MRENYVLQLNIHRVFIKSPHKSEVKQPPVHRKAIEWERRPLEKKEKEKKSGERGKLGTREPTQPWSVKRKSEQSPNLLASAPPPTPDVTESQTVTRGRTTLFLCPASKASSKSSNHRPVSLLRCLFCFKCNFWLIDRAGSVWEAWAGDSPSDEDSVILSKAGHTGQKGLDYLSLSIYIYIWGITLRSFVDVGSVLPVFICPAVDVAAHYLGLNEAFLFFGSPRRRRCFWVTAGSLLVKSRVIITLPVSYELHSLSFRRHLYLI